MKSTIPLKLKVLKKLAFDLNEAKITWNLGASANLYLRGIVSDFHDLDIMILEKDVEKVKEIMSNIALLKDKKPSSNFGTKIFLNYMIDTVDIDIMAGFAIKHQEKMHHFPLRENMIFDVYLLDDVKIYLEDIDIWLTYYVLMERKDKINIIKTYMKEVEK
ncbi:MAG: hypothetical protein CVV61_06690 [Tenericutes bacterium HGW-Tenericutes-6]|nr:MAG: hypothetical protein CVV61_06690 [Tenericutes bacterium HGW-Tenericutes-6]